MDDNSKKQSQDRVDASGRDAIARMVTETRHPAVLAAALVRASLGGET